MKSAWENFVVWLIKFRTWLFNGIGGFVVLILPLLGAPEIMALLDPTQQKWVIAAAFVINIWMRPRPAVTKDDPEAEITRLRKGLAK